MSLSQVSIRRPVLMTVLAIGTMVLGFFGAMNLGIRKFPNVDSPVITVRTSYSGANAAVVESEVTEILEESINSASGIKSLVSTSSDGSSTIRVEFEVGADLEAAANDIRDRVSRVQRRLPDAVDPPTVFKSDSDSDPILMVSLMSDSRDAMEVSEIARNLVKERLQTISGVSEVTLWGEKQPVVRLWLDPVRMQSLGVTASEISAALVRENQELPAGKIEGATTDLSIRALGRLDELPLFSGVAIRTAPDGTVIRLSDVANIHYEPKDPRTGFKRNGKNVIAVAIIAQPGANHVDIADQFYKRIEEIRRDLPSDVQIIRGMDSSVSIRASIREVIETIFISFVLVILTIFIFLREGRSTLIPMVVIPVSLVGCFFILYFFGFSINVLTLLAMVLAIGLVVDDAIVIVENIYQKIEEGMTPKQAAVAGTNEIFFAVIATSMVLMAVFLPMLVLGGVTGLLFREFVAVMIGTVFLSTVSALTLSPMLCSKFLRMQNKGRFYMMTEPFFEWLNRMYDKSLGMFLRVRWMVFVLIAALGGVTYFCFTHLSSEMAPMEDSGMFFARVQFPEGTGLSRTRSSVENFVDVVRENLDSSEYEEIQAGANGAGNAMVRFTLNEDPNARRSQSAIARDVQTLAYEFPDMRVMVIEPQTVSTGRGGMPIQFVLQAPDIDILRELLPEFLAEADKSPFFTVVNSNLTFTKPELHLNILRDKARAEGVSVENIATAIQLGMGDQTYGEFYLEGRQYDIIGSVGYEYRDRPAALSALTVRNAKGEMLSLDHFVEYHEVSASPSRPRYNRFNAATVSAGLTEGKTIGDGLEEMRRIADRVLKKYPNVSTELAGATKEYVESSSGLYVTFLLALAFIFLILAGQFESFRAPFVTLFTVPLALSGALASLYLFGQTLNIFSEIALILLLGLVTKNGILIVEFANQIARNTGCSALEAARESAKRRFRPILMTSFSTVGGAIPLIVMGAPSRVAMGVAIVGGLSFAALMTLYVVPAAYSYFAGKTEKISTDATKMAGFLLPVLGAGLSILLFAPTSASADTLSPDQAVKIALEKKHSVLIAREQLKSAEAMNSLGANGMLPTLDLSLSRYYNYGDSYSKTQAGVKTDIDDDLEHTDQLQVALNYTLFNGFRSWNSYQLSSSNKNLAEIELRDEIENTASSVLNTYLSAVSARESFRVAEENVKFSAERRDLTNEKYNVGAVTRLDALSSQMDYTTDSAASLTAETALRSALRMLDQELGGGVIPVEEYTLLDSVWVNRDPPWKTPEGKQTVLKNALERSAAIQMAAAERKTASLKRKSASSSLYPQLNLHGSWNYSGSAADKGNPADANSKYFRVGAAASWNLFNGLSDRATIETAKIEERTATLKEEEARLSVETAVSDALDKHLRALDALQVAEGNLSLADETLAIAEEQLRAGSITAFEFRELQNRRTAAYEALILSRIQANSAEIMVKLLSGEILRLD
ncbi:MAG: efflux RND transporter permease subunit [Fibrobacter sp.]|jgi:hydrophobe/amphiphile efflux-1 (HAE1) family protein|nr:efflux RND transporter permease subunit [Fibrobacter sp.]